MHLGSLLYRHNKYFIILFDIFLVILSFLILSWIKPATIRIVLPQYINPFIFYSIIWTFISLIMGKYDLIYFKKPGHLIVIITVNTFIILSIVTTLLFALKLSEFSRLMVFGTIILCYFFEIISFRIIYAWLKIKKGKYEKTENNLTNFQRNEPFNVERYTKHEKSLKKTPSTREKLIIREAGEDVFEYFTEHLNINDRSVSLISTTTPFNIENLPGDGLHAIINLKKVNEMPEINKLFEAVNFKLADTGLYVGCVETSKQRYVRLASDFPHVLKKPSLIFDFILNRIFPRIWGVRNIYYAITSGVKSTISKAEVLGRLISCGFEIIEYKEINNLTYFVVMKTGTPLINPVQTYGSLYKAPRIGKNGAIFYVYKFRTMHPFSEYLQDYILQLNGYPVIGRIADDFRLTRWGKFMRKYWLDELPQLINVIKGEMKIVGIRPLSKNDYEEYPEDVKEMRKKHKPGCIPPYLALLGQGMKQSIEAERIYLMEKQKKPVTTDIKYFKLALINIITNKIKNV